MCPLRGQHRPRRASLAHFLAGCKLRNMDFGGPPGWLSRLCLTGSGHDLTVRGIKPHVRLCADSAEPAWDSLSLSLALPLLTPSLSLSQK